MPRFPSINAKVKSNKFLIKKDGKRMKNKNVIATFIKKTSRTLKINLPEKIVEGAAIS